METRIIYTDGACKGNPGNGGWGYVMIVGGVADYCSGYELYTTNNKMELAAVIAALAKTAPSTKAIIYSDSEYVVNGMNQGWVKRWKKNYWLTKDKLPVRNKAQWEQLDSLCATRDVTFTWVKGHSRMSYNDFCDKLASNAARQRAGVSGKCLVPDLFSDYNKVTQSS